MTYDPGLRLTKWKRPCSSVAVCSATLAPSTVTATPVTGEPFATTTPLKTAVAACAGADMTVHCNAHAIVASAMKKRLIETPAFPPPREALLSRLRELERRWRTVEQKREPDVLARQGQFQARGAELRRDPASACHEICKHSQQCRHAATDPAHSQCEDEDAHQRTQRASDNIVTAEGTALADLRR